MILSLSTGFLHDPAPDRLFAMVRESGFADVELMVGPRVRGDKGPGTFRRAVLGEEIAGSGSSVNQIENIVDSDQNRPAD